MTGSYTNERYPTYENPRADNYGCYCVPYDQCLPHEVARKEDGIAGIDPRNIGKTDIEAIGLDEVVVTDGNGTIVSHHKKTDKDDKVKRETVIRTRRDVAAAQDKQDAEPVSATWPFSSSFISKVRTVFRSYTLNDTINLLFKLLLKINDLNRTARCLIRF